jgi:hypothetical protein
MMMMMMIIMLLVVTITQGTHNYVPETKYVPTVYSVADVLWLQFVVHIMLFRILMFRALRGTFRIIIIIIIIIICNGMQLEAVPVAILSKSWFSGHLLAGIAGSNPARSCNISL